MAALRPHDLLFLRRGAVFEACEAGCALPGWLDAAWLERAPLVVRRAVPASGRVAAGARGLQRKQRCAGHVSLAEVARRVTPEKLADEVLADRRRIAAAADVLPCVAALLDLAPRLRDLGLAWGPAGGAGFWLACGQPVLRPTSDLDLLVRAPAPLPPATLAALCALQRDAACRVDIQVDTGAGGFALNEYARGGRVLLKTGHGPLLVTDPWAAHDVARKAA
jgi:phosphoribosyl-dephospho-CoA transferase